MLVRLVCPYVFGPTELPPGALIACSEREADTLVRLGVAERATEVLSAWL